MCYRTMRAVFGCSMDLLASVAGTPKAKASPCPYRAPRLGLLFISVLGMFFVFVFVFFVLVLCWRLLLHAGLAFNAAITNTSDVIEMFLHNLIDELVKVQSDKGNI